MSIEDLTSPLQRAGSGGLASKLRVPSSILYILLFAVIIIGIFGWYMMNRNPLGGEPRSVVAITNPGEKKSENTTQSGEIRVAGGKEEEASSQISQQTSHEQKAEVEQQPTETPPDKIIINGGKKAESAVKSRPLRKAPIKDLFTRTPTGLLPKISTKNGTPAQAYARPLSFDVTAANKDQPRIAILVTGLGISPTATGEAIRNLPGAISLAFAPYAKNLQATVSKARSIGHEVLLQLPMEPFDYPDNDPGPHTLLADTSTRENNMRTDWLLTRFTGYTGVTNYMGAKFTASPDAIKPFLNKIKEHGLFYFEDGASGRSQTSAISKAMGTAYAKGNLVIDAEQNKTTIRQQLARLENIARDRGMAVGVGTALPVTIDSISEWAKSLTEKGITLIPVSATALQQK